MKKLTFKFLLVLLTFNFLLLTLPTYVSAHILKSSGSVGAVMHIQPDDDPIVGEISSFYFDFKDKNNKFSAQDCTCLLTILKNSEEVFVQPLFQDHSVPSLTNASVQYTFPEKGVYTIKITGAPKSEPTFEAFTLEYDIRVERTSQWTKSADTNWITEHLSIIIGGVLGFSALAFVMIKSRKHV